MMELGHRVPDEELRVIEEYKNVVFVSYQTNGYKDERLELRILQKVFKKCVDDLLLKQPNSEFLLLQDSLTAHKSDVALK